MNDWRCAVNERRLWIANYIEKMVALSLLHHTLSNEYFISTHCENINEKQKNCDYKLFSTAKEDTRG